MTDNENMDKTMLIAGVPVVLIPIDKEKLKGLSLDTLLSFRFYRTELNGQELCVAESTDEARSYTPLSYSRIANIVERIVAMPVAFYLPSVPSYIRSRFIEQGVYFIISDQYVFLPGMLINERLKRANPLRKLLSPVGQYVFLYYLLHPEIEQFTIQKIQPHTPYNYLAISRAVNELEEVKLFSTQKEWKTKQLSALMSREELWKQALPLLSSPVKRTVYTDELWDAPFYKGGITALSHYSLLNPDKRQTVAVWEKELNPNGKTMLEWDTSEFKYKIEVWRYSPLTGIEQNGYVDKLSLYLSMQDDKDPRVEKELETIINDIWK
jgi:hypothetical protein